MPRNVPSGRRPKVSNPQALAQNNLLWQQTGVIQGNQLVGWDPKPEPLINAILAILQSGCTLVLRPGSGNRSMGAAIWQGDTRQPPVWLYDAEELDAWAADINRQVEPDEEESEE